MSQQLDVCTMQDGAVVEMINDSLQMIAENVADINTPPDKLRELVLKIKFKPDQSRAFVAATAVVQTKLQPCEPQHAALILDKINGKATLFESFSGQNPLQHTFEGTSKAEIQSKNNVTPFRKAQGDK